MLSLCSSVGGRRKERVFEGAPSEELLSVVAVEDEVLEIVAHCGPDVELEGACGRRAQGSHGTEFWHTEWVLALTGFWHRQGSGTLGEALDGEWG